MYVLYRTCIVGREGKGKGKGEERSRGMVERRRRRERGDPVWIGMGI